MNGAGMLKSSTEIILQKFRYINRTINMNNFFDVFKKYNYSFLKFMCLHWFVHRVQLIRLNGYLNNRFLFTLKVSFKFCNICYLSYLLIANRIFDEHFVRLHLLSQKGVRIR